MSRTVEATRALLLGVLDHAYDRASWHGPNLTGALRGVDAAAAARRVGRRKTVWEQALHAAYWKHRVLNKLAGRTPFAREGSNWPALPPEVTQAAWRADLRMLADVHGRLRAAVAGLPAARLTPKSVKLIHGVAFHDIYHAGQIKLLRRIAEEQGGGDDTPQAVRAAPSRQGKRVTRVRSRGGRPPPPP
jgi:hypothetical protein